MRMSNYLVSNLDSSNKLLILTTCPWFIDKSPLLTRTWLPNFSPSTSSKISTIWITFTHLPIEYICPDILKIIGNSIGKIIAFDQNNLNNTLISATRICAELDIAKNPQFRLSSMEILLTLLMKTWGILIFQT